MKRFFALIAALAMLLGMTACSGQDQTVQKPETVPEEIVTPEPEPEPETVPDPEAEPETQQEPEIDLSTLTANPLTGEPIEAGLAQKRPVMVMLNNVKQSLPQSGNGQADIIYEVLEEGGITRMLAVYQDISAVEGNLGTIRSTRHYYVDLVAGMDGILVHAGGSPQAYDAISNLGIDDLDALKGGASGLFWRDHGRLNSGYATEHTMYITASQIADYLAASAMRTEHQPGFSVQQTFAEDATPDGSVANTITVKFSGYKTGVFTYDPESGRYLVSEYDEPYLDATSGEQVSVKNVLILCARISAIPGDAKGRQDIQMSGTGIGWYASGGKYIPINWKRVTETSQYQFTTVDGEPLTLSVGNSYVNLIPPENTPTFVG